MTLEQSAPGIAATDMSNGPKRPAVCAVVLAHGSPDDLKLCLSSLECQVGVQLQVALVQNGASDQLMNEVEVSHPTVKLIRNGENVGAAAGRNIGIRWASSVTPDFIFFADNDATFACTAIQELARYAGTHPEAGFLGCVVYRKYEPTKIFGAGGFLRPPLHDEHVLSVEQSLTALQVDFVGSGAMLVPARTVELIGGFDERLFVYDEDIDWCLRGRQVNLESVVVAHAAAYHDVPRGKFNPRLVYYRTRNRLTVAKRFGYIASIWNREVLRWILSSIVRMMLVGDDLAWSCAFAFGLAVLDFLRNRGGKCPRAFEQANDAYPEARARRAIQKTRAWQVARHLKHLITLSSSNPSCT